MAAPPYLTSVAGSGTGQYYADQYGQPYMIRWDTMWNIIPNAGNSGGATTWQSDMDAFCAIRSGQGFNGFEATTTSVPAIGSINEDGRTWDGILPFVGGDPSVLTATFWDRVDYLVASAASYGMTFCINPFFRYSYTDSGGALNGCTTTQAGNYGAAVGARYADAVNVVWSVGDDYEGDFDSTLTAFLNGLRGAGAGQLISVENHSESTSRFFIDSSTATPWGTSNAQFQWCYSYNTTYNAIEYAYTEASPLPVARMDGYYQNQALPTLTEGARLYLRKATWWALSSGSRGFNMGRQDTFPWPVNIVSSGLLASNTFDNSDLKTIWNIFSSLQGWHQLVPDTSSALVTAGRGTHQATLSHGGSDAGYAGGNTYVTASKTANGMLAVIYIPNAAVAVTVNGALMVSGYGAKWVDPVNGAVTTATIAGTYSHAAVNSAGDSDWLLVLANPGTAIWNVP